MVLGPKASQALLASLNASHLFYKEFLASPTIPSLRSAMFQFTLEKCCSSVLIPLIWRSLTDSVLYESTVPYLRIVST